MRSIVVLDPTNFTVKADRMKVILQNILFCVSKIIVVHCIRQHYIDCLKVKVNGHGQKATQLKF